MQSNVSISLPKEVFHRMEDLWGNVEKRTLEVLAVEAYRSDVITTAEVQRMLNLETRWQVDEFLKSHQAYMDYTEDDLKKDVEAIRRLKTK
ncbi:UPF0175 family protein [Candidatus Babeliales bacterium]|nr:UPF0175 family protein [Candidatus Babeliales bacterium]